MSAEAPKMPNVLAESLRFCLDACLGHDEFMANYRKLTGHTILAPDLRTGLDRMIDKATGYDPHTIKEEEARHFYEFERDYVWKPWLLMEIEAGR